MKILGVFISTAAIAIAASAANAATETYDLEGFTEAQVSSGINAIIEVGGDYSIRAEGDEDHLERLKVEKRGDALLIGREGNWRGMFKSTKVTVYVTMPAIEGISVSSGADAKVSGVDAAKFDASTSSGADLIVDGTCGFIDASASSGSDLDARALECSTADASASSGADIYVYASEEIDASASSGADVNVFGNPEKRDVSKSSGGDVRFRDQGRKRE